MTKHTRTRAERSDQRERSRSPLTGAHFRELRHRIAASGRHYTAAHFASDLKISESLLQFVETNQRSITPELARAYQRVERDFLYCLKELDALDAETAAWLVTALARYTSLLTPQDKRRLKKIIAAL